MFKFIACLFLTAASIVAQNPFSSFTVPSYTGRMQPNNALAGGLSQGAQLVGVVSYPGASDGYTVFTGHPIWIFTAALQYSLPLAMEPANSGLGAENIFYSITDISNQTNLIPFAVPGHELLWNSPQYFFPQPFDDYPVVEHPPYWSSDPGAINVSVVPWTAYFLEVQVPSNLSMLGAVFSVQAFRASTHTPDNSFGIVGSNEALIEVM